ncbi:MAG: hypothetical protein Q8N95_07865 [Desulfobacterales bacterium]|nr:hypothetical protein [Desulfobacterales bacterium]
MKPSILTFACKIVVMTFCIMGLEFSPAAGVEFITREKFLSEKNPYKDLPVRILFKKLSESQGDEKRQIRNLIILKQVFEQGMQEQEKAGLVKYKRTYGIIKELSRETLKVSAAETGQDVSYHVGIEGIPLENPRNYNISTENAGRYAAIIYTLDERIYKIEIGFLIAEPAGLSLKRSGENNVISWNSPGTVQKPSGYQVFINDRIFKTVEDPVADIPRTKGKSDVYKVKAVYKHGSGVIVSAASGELQDHITLAEINQEKQGKSAAEKYALVTSGLKTGEWENAKSLLYENKALFAAHLSKPQQDAAAALVVFFNRIDEGDRLIEAVPQTTESLDKAVESYGRAQEQAGELDVGFIKQEKIKSASARQAALKTQQQKELASGRYALVTAALMSGEWEKARIRLYENRSLFTAHLSKPQQDDATALAVFFSRIDDGDRLAAEAPETVKSLDKAVEAFGQAPEKAGGLDVGYIRKEKIRLIMARQAALKEQQQKEQQLKDIQLKEQQQKEEQQKDQQQKEQQQKEQQLKDLQLKEQQQKEEQLKEKQLKEQAARVAKAEPVMPPERSSAEPLTGQVTPTSGIKQAVIDFKEKKYTSAFNNFMTIYGSQINGIQKGGSGYIKGVLGLPPRYRAEILFLVEYERLREKNNNDAEAIRTGLEEMFGNIEGMQGPWAIITEDKRTLIKNHINDFK